jgi:hypothetical protein
MKIRTLELADDQEDEDLFNQKTVKRLTQNEQEDFEDNFELDVLELPDTERKSSGERASDEDHECLS